MPKSSRLFLIMVSISSTVAAVTLPSVKRVAVIGAGAGGLIAASVLKRDGFDVTVFDKLPIPGGVWAYGESDGPMYRSLRTNLPKEIMAFNEDSPFPETLPSFLTHKDVQDYLLSFAVKLNLRDIVKFSTSVDSILPTDSSKERSTTSGSSWLVKTSTADGTSTRAVQEEQVFDAVVVCNGHYNEPLSPKYPGMEHFKGQISHSKDYDIPDQYAGRSVLVVGSKSSGTDMAREISAVAGRVYVSERALDPSQSSQHGNIYHKPVISHFEEGDGSVVFADGDRAIIDDILWCTGYAYDYPFLSQYYESENPNCVRVINGRKVANLYQQLFSISHPTLSFIGLPFNVVPFPIFYLQAEWISAVYAGRKALPTVEEQLVWYDDFEQVVQQRHGSSSGGSSPSTQKSTEKYHYMGGELQWEYCRLLAQEAGCDSERRLKFLETISAIYRKVSGNKPPYPGAADSYRDVEYRVNRETLEWSIL